MAENTFSRDAYAIETRIHSYEEVSNGIGTVIVEQCFK